MLLFIGDALREQHNFGQEIVELFLSYCSFGVDFGQSGFLMSELKALNMVEYLFCFHLHQGWRVQAFMFYGFPAGQFEVTGRRSRNRKPVHPTFSRHQKVTSPSPLQIGALSYSLLLGPAHRLLAQRQEKKTRNLRISFKRNTHYNLSKTKQETEKLRSIKGGFGP